MAGGASVYSANKQAKAAEKAGRRQEKAADRASDLQYQQFQQTRRDLAPWRNIGQQSLYQLADLYGVPRGPGQDAPAAPDYSSFYESPGYQFRLEEGRNMAEKSMAGRGLLQSGSTLRGLTQLGQGMASEEFNNYANRLASMAGIGQSTGTALGQFGAQSAANQGNLMMQGANARASGYMGAANAWSQGAQGLGQAAGWGLGMYGAQQGWF